MNHPVQYYYDSVRDIQQSQVATYYFKYLSEYTFTNVLKCYVTRNPALACARNTLLFFLFHPNPSVFRFSVKLLQFDTEPRRRICAIRTCSKIICNSNTHIVYMFVYRFNAVSNVSIHVK